MHMLGTCLKLPYHYTILYHLYTAKVWMSLSPQNVNAKILMPSMIALGDRALGRWLGHEGAALRSEISAYKGGPWEIPHPFHLVRTAWEVWNLQKGSHSTMLATNLGIPAS